MQHPVTGLGSGNAESSAGRATWSANVLRTTFWSRRRNLLALVMAVIVYASGLLWPFHFRAPVRVTNEAVWTESATLRFGGPGLAISRVAPAWEEASRDLGTFQVDLRVRSFSPAQQGPARLFSLARDTRVQNLVIGQAGDDLVVRLRGLCRGLRALGTDCPKELRMAGVFASSDWVDIRLAVAPGLLKLQVGDRPTLRTPLGGEPLRAWDTDQRLALGNDVSGLRPWLGELGRVTVETPSGSEDWLQADRFELPDRFWLLDREPKLLPFYHSSRSDLVVNFLLYMPMAILVAACFPSFGWPQVGYTVGIVLAMSSALEFAQLFVESRNFSTTDILLNVTGGAMVSLAIFWLSKRCRWQVH